MAMDDKGGMSGYSKPMNKPNSKKKIAERKAAREASGMSAQKFYVKTRMAEAAKSGKTLNAKDLRKKFQSGDVARKGFGAPKKKTGTTSTVAAKVKPAQYTPPRTAKPQDRGRGSRGASGK